MIRHRIPEWRVYVAGELHGAYIHREHADATADRLRRKGRRAKVTRKLAVW